MKRKQTISTGIRFDESRLEYTIAIRKRKKYWLLLLLLLLIPLFINLEKDMEVQIFDHNGHPVNAAKVEFSFVSSHLYKHGKFFVNDTLSGRRSERTGADGICEFKNCPYSIYGMIFKMLHQSRINVSSDCIVPLETQQPYYYTFGKQTLYVEKEIADVTVKVLDSEDGELISGATVYYRYRNEEKTVTDSAKTNAAGYIVIKGLDKCGTIERLHGSCYGYIDDTKTAINVIDCVKNPSKANLLLEPVKESVTFFVTNCNSKQPLPGATATIIVSNPQKSKRYLVSTNTDGRGRASWREFHILSEISIVVAKQGFKNGQLAGKYTVEQFAAMPDSKRTICMEPNPQTLEFVNVDTLIMEGIKGVKNEICISSASRVDNRTEFSGSNGVFFVETLEGDKVDITSEKSPDYYPAKAHFETLSQQNGIFMFPKVMILGFRVLDAVNRFPVQTVTDVHLKWSYASKGKPLQMVKRGDTIFAQDMNIISNYYSIPAFYPHDVSIEVTAKGYEDNHQISNMPVKDFLASAEMPEILMKPACAAKTFNASNDKYSLFEYDMNGYNGEFLFEYHTHGEPDTIIIYDAPKKQRDDSNIIFYYDKASISPQNTMLKFKSPVITVEVFGKSAAWRYEISCPK
jgi:hypothetical protein